MDNERFDDLIRSLGQRVSRRGVLAALTGVTGLGVSERGASARRRRKRRDDARRGGQSAALNAQANRGNSHCATFCKALFPPGPDRGRCISDAARDHGLCQACGGDTALACPQEDGSYICCANASDVCGEGACCTPKTCGTGCTCGMLDPGCGLPPIDCAHACETGQYCEIRPGLGLACCNCGFGGCGGNNESTCPDGDVLNPGSGGLSTCDGGVGGSGGGGSGCGGSGCGGGGGGVGSPGPGGGTGGAPGGEGPPPGP